MVVGRASDDRAHVDAHPLLVHGLALAALIAATLEYELMIRRRAVRRAWEKQVRAAQDSGLNGLVRIFLTDRQTDPG